MKKSLLFISQLFITGWLAAQITVTNTTFPVAGDTLRTAVDFTPTGIDVQAAGGPFDWDFTSLNVGIQNETVFRNASEGSVFGEIPAATHVVIDNALGTEAYFRVGSDKVEFLAANGNDPTGFGIAALFRFTPPIVERRAPMTYPQNNTTESNLLIGFAWSDLPPVLTDSLDLPFSPDSIRVRIASTRRDSLNAYGTLAIPGGTYDVLREKRTQINETRVEVKVFIWLDVTDLLTQGFEGLGVDTTITYEYYSSTEKEVIASVAVDENDNPMSVTFKDNGLLTNNREVVGEAATVTLRPNPVNSWGNFVFDHFPKGDYTLSIFDWLGRQVAVRSLLIEDNSVASIDLSHLPAAGYIYVLKNEEGKIFAHGKLVKG